MIRRSGPIGDALGVAFHDRRRLLDYGGDAAATGKKRVGDDFREGKLTLPIIKAIAPADGCRADILEPGDRQGQARRLPTSSGRSAFSRAHGGDGNDDGTMPSPGWRPRRRALEGFAEERPARHCSTTLPTTCSPGSDDARQRSLEVIAEHSPGDPPTGVGRARIVPPGGVGRGGV